MTRQGQAPVRIEPLPPVLLRKPLDYLLADHLRQRVLCQLCDDLATPGEFDRKAADMIVAFLAHEMPVHVIDEEEDLFPLLRRRAEAEDDIEPALGKLSGEHATDRDLAEDILGGLRRILERGEDALDTKIAGTLARFADSQRRHLALENATVMPLAKLRLKAKDLADLSRRMAARRGILLDELDGAAS